MESKQENTGIVAIVIAVAAVALCCFGTLMIAGVGAAGIGALTHSLRYVLPVVLVLFVIISVIAYRRWKGRQP